MRYSSPEQRRAALLDQLAYLIDEVEALKPVIDQVPEALQQLKTDAAGLSLRETYGWIAAYDELVMLPQLQQLLAEETPTLVVTDEQTLIAEASFNEQAPEVLLAEVQRARRDVLAVLQAISADAWNRKGLLDGAPVDVYALAHSLTQHDANLLRAIGYHLEALMPKRHRAGH